MITIIQIKKFYKVTILGLTSLLLMLVLSHVFNQDDSLLLIVLGVSIVTLVLTLMVTIVYCLTKSSLRNLQSLKTIIISTTVLYISAIITLKMTENYWNLEVMNNSKQSVSYHICHLDGNYDYEVSIAKTSSKHVYIPIHKLKNSKVSICLEDVGCAFKTKICRGWGGCIRKESKITSATILKEAKENQWKYVCPKI